MCDLFAQTQGIPKMMAVINLLSNGKEKAVTLIARCDPKRHFLVLFLVLVVGF
jgi:diacylglycerol kinase family enzyme